MTFPLFRQPGTGPLIDLAAQLTASAVIPGGAGFVASGLGTPNAISDEYLGPAEIFEIGTYTLANIAKAAWRVPAAIQLTGLRVQQRTPGLTLQGNSTITVGTVDSAFTAFTPLALATAAINNNDGSLVSVDLSTPIDVAKDSLLTVRWAHTAFGVTATDYPTELLAGLLYQQTVSVALANA